MGKKIISFKCQKKIYYFFIFWISELVIIICDNYFPTEYLKIKMKFNNLDYKHAKLENIKINQITLAICRIISKLLAGIGILCNFEISIDNISENKTKFFLLIIISILLFLFKFLNFIYHLITKCMDKVNDYVMDWVIGIYIISTIIFCKYINKEMNFYRHQKASILLTSISFSLLTFVDAYSIIKEDKHIKFSYKLFYILLYVLRSIFFPLINSISKNLMNQFLTPIKLIFWEGVFEAILLALSLPILYFSQIFKLGNFNFDTETLLIFIFVKIGYIIICYVRNLMVLKIINYFNPTYLFCMISINSFISFVAHLIMNKNDSIYHDSIWFFILDCISLIILSLSALLYNEILIIHICGLNDKIMNQLEDIARNESFYSYYSEDDE